MRVRIDWFKDIVRVGPAGAKIEFVTIPEISVLSVCRGLSGGDWTSPGISDNP